jgi:hypothetical protein
MKKHLLSCLALFSALACAGGPGYETDEELGEVEQAVGLANNGGGYYWGVVDSSAAPHSHRRCLSGSQTCSLPRTKGPTYKLLGLTTAQANLVRAAFASIDSQVNWVFTETTGSSPTISVNNAHDHRVHHRQRVLRGLSA